MRHGEAGNQKVIQAAAELVDHGRAGTLSRLEETIEFAKLMDYKRIGLAYCYGKEGEAKAMAYVWATTSSSRATSKAM